MESVRSTKNRISNDRHARLDLNFVKKLSEVLTSNGANKSDLLQILNKSNPINNRNNKV